MRKSLVIASLLVLGCSASAFAGVPDPSMSGTGTSGASIGGCHYVFVANGSGDTMSVDVTLRDAFGTPVASCATSATLSFNDDGGDLVDALCPCADGLVMAGATDVNGIVSFSWSSLGGYGNADVTIEATCVGTVTIDTINIDYTSPDLDGSCEVGASTGVIDLGVWAGGLAAPFQPSDYDCSGGVNTVIDLGVWAGGLGNGC